MVERATSRLIAPPLLPTVVLVPLLEKLATLVVSPVTSPGIAVSLLLPAVVLLAVFVAEGATVLTSKFNSYPLCDAIE